MQKKFITNLGFLLLLNLLIKPFWLFGIDRAVQNATGAEAYGDYYALLNFSFLFNILLDLGITNFNSRNISMNRHLLQKHLSGIITLRMLLALAYCGASMVAALIIGYDLKQLSTLLILLLNQFLISGILYLRSNLSGLHMFKHDSIVSVLDRFIMIVICSWLLWGRAGAPFRIEWFIWAQTGAYMVTILAVGIFLTGRVSLLKLKWNPLFALMILKKSYPFAALILLMTFYNRVDSVMLERLLPDGARQSGIYAQSYRLMEAGNMIAFLFAGLLLPIFAAMIKQKEDVGPLLKTSYSLIVTPAIAVAAIFLFNSYDLMSIMYKFHAKESSMVTPFLMISFVSISTTYIFGTLLTASGDLKTLNIMASGGMVLNILLNLILIPRYQAEGAAIASMITQSSMAISQILLCKKNFMLKINQPFILKLLLLTLISILFCYFLNFLMPRGHSVLLKSIITGIITIGVSVGLRVINVSELVKIIREKQS